MQDKQLLGDNPNDKSTVSATSDMSASQLFIPKDFQFKPVKPAHKDLDVTAGDMFKAVGSGALRSVAGFGELSENLFGVGESLRDLANSGADSLTSSMTEDGQAAVNSRLLEDNENGNPAFSDASGDIDVWAMKIADGLGSLVTNFAGGGVAGGAAKIALKNTIAKSMLKKGFGSEAAGLIADKAISISASTGAVATGMGTSLGGASLDAYNATMALDSGWLAENSDYFKQAALRLSELPESEGKSATEIFDLAKEETARYASAQMSTDPTAIAASVAGAMGDKYLFGALLGKMGKGAVSGAVKGAISEGGTEFIEGYGQTVAQNQIVGDVTGQDIDPTEGAMTNALEGMLIGGALGAPIGTVGGAISKRTASDDDQDVNPPAATPAPGVDNEPVASAEPQQPAQEPEARTRRPLFNGDSVKSYLSDANKLKGELANFKTNKRNKELVDDLSSGLDRHTNALVNNPDMSPEDIQTAQRGLQNIFTQYQQLYSPEATFDSIYQSTEPVPVSESESVIPSDGSNVVQSESQNAVPQQGATAASGEGQTGTPTDTATNSATHSDVVLQQQRISSKLKQLRAQKPDSQEYADLDSTIQGYGESLNAPQQAESLQAVKSHFDVIELAIDGELNRPDTNQAVSPQKEGQTTRQALVNKGVLPERNAYQEVIDLARAWDPDRARDIETALRSDSISKTEASKLETEYENMAAQASAAGVDPLATNFDRRVESNRQNMANREKPVERAARKGQEYDLSDSITRRRKAIREEIQQSMLPEDRKDKRKLERMVDLEYSRRYPGEEVEPTEQVDNGLEQFEQPEFNRANSQRAIESRAQQASNAAKLRESELERESREPSPEENPNWFGTNPRTGERTTRSYMRDIANREAQSQLSEDKAESERIETRQANLTNRREQLAELVSGFGQRPNSMKMREDGKKPIRDFTGINAKTTRMSKRLRKRLNRAKGFDSDAVLQELQQHEKRLAAYEQAARDRAEQEANNPENIKRRKSAESLFQEYISDAESKEFAENEITTTIRNISDALSQSPSTVLEFNNESMPVAKVRAQLANGVRTLSDKYLGKTAAMMERTRQKKAQREMEDINDRNRSKKADELRYSFSDARNRSKAPRRAQQGETNETSDFGFTKNNVTQVVPGVEHLGRAPDDQPYDRLSQAGYELIVNHREGQFGERYNVATQANPALYVTTEHYRGPYTLWKKPSREIIKLGEQVVRDVIKKNGGTKPSMKGVRNAYRDAGFTAAALQEALGDTTISSFESNLKKEVAAQWAREALVPAGTTYTLNEMSTYDSSIGGNVYSYHLAGGPLLSNAELEQWLPKSGLRNRKTTHSMKGSLSDINDFLTFFDAKVQIGDVGSDGMQDVNDWLSSHIVALGATVANSEGDKVASSEGEKVVDSESKNVIEIASGVTESDVRGHVESGGTIKDGDKEFSLKETKHGWVVAETFEMNGELHGLEHGGNLLQGGFSKAEATDKLWDKVRYSIPESETDSQNNNPGQNQEANEIKPVDSNIGLLNAIKNRVKFGFEIKNNTDLKRLAAKLLGIEKQSDVTGIQLKKVQEAYETVKIAHRRHIATKVLSKNNSPASVKNVFDKMVEEYEAQPRLNARSANSAKLQAYSTPAPLAFLGNVVSGIDATTTVLEPTAGNGLLLMTAKPGNTFANELDPVRAESLAWTGFSTTVLDATGNPLTNGMVSDKVDRVITNPPFGGLRDESGQRVKFEFTSAHGKEHKIGELDHMIAYRALESMKSDGKAYLIMGTSKDKGNLSAQHRSFLNWLFQNYNVTDYTEIDGKLYEKQGAAWPIMLVAVDGRAAEPTGRFAPVDSQFVRHNSWESLYEHYNEKGLLDTQSSRYEHITTSPASVRAGYESAASVTGLDNNDAGTQGSNAAPGSASNNATTPGSQNSNGSTDGSRLDGPNQSDELHNGNGIRNASGEVSRPRPVSTEGTEVTTGRPQASTSRPGPGDRSGSSNVKGDERPAPTDKKRKNQFQSAYSSASSGKNENILTPSNIEYYTSKALTDLTKQAGDIDQYVADKLGYNSTDDVHKAFMGLQSDGVALAVNAIEQGKAIVIGDQTGVGKGRQAAGVLRYALEQGKVPIFITQKPNLFTDMVDDLADIGVNDFKPLIMNADQGIKRVDNPGTTKEKAYYEHKLSSAKLQPLLQHIVNTGTMPEGYTGLFLTYSQISSDQKGFKRAVLNALAPSGVMVMDEAHTAASGKDSRAVVGEFFQGADNRPGYVERVDGLVYLSATYAKRPENMALYKRTDLGQAAGGRDITDSIERGGYGMQNYIAAKIAEAGHYVRRERSFEGIEIRDEIISADSQLESTFDSATSALRSIQSLSSAWSTYVETELAQDIAIEHGLDTGVGGNKADKNINVNSFSSVVHNYISQLTLGLKADKIADLAIDAINRGEKPVIALENTLGTALNDYMTDNGLSFGDSLGDLNYGTFLSRTIDGVLAYSVKEPGEKKGKKIKVSIDEVSNPLVVALYEQAQAAVEKMSEFDIPASPIDHMRYRLEQAGHKVAEITGRDAMIDYRTTKLKKRSAKEVKDRRGSVDQFNAGKLDVLILNQAGSTGLSIHAREDYQDTRTRYMIVAQPSLDINTYMQMLGRVNRTGQVVVPKYANAWLDLPSEKRPAAVLSGKMASLNANTSGSTNTATSVKSFDLLNKYGDEVVAQYVSDNFKELIEYSPDFEKVGLQESPANWFLGKLAVLPIKMQRKVLNDLDEAYSEKITYLNATGQNDLDLTELDLQAHPLEQQVLVEGDDSRGVFSEPVYLTKIEAKAKGKAPTWTEVESAMNDFDKGSLDSLVENVTSQANEYLAKLEGQARKAKEIIDDAIKRGVDTTKATESHQKALNNIEDYKARIAEYKRRVSNAHRQFVNVTLATPGAESTELTGVIVDVTHESKSGDPLANSKTKLKVMVADRSRVIPLNYKHFYDSTITPAGYYTTKEHMEHIFNRQAEQPQQEIRYVMTGNLIMANDQTLKNGNIIPFTTKDGRVIQGMLLPGNFAPDTDLRTQITSTPQEALEWLKSTNNRELGSLGLSTEGGNVLLRKRHDYQRGTHYVLEMPKSVSKGMKYWGNPDVEAVIGEQAVSGGGTFTVRIDESDLDAIVSAFDGIEPLNIRNAAQAEDYNRVNGIESDKPTSDNIVFRRTPQSVSVDGNAVSESRVNRTLIESWTANIIRDNPVIASASEIIRVVSRESELPGNVRDKIDDGGFNDTVKGVYDGKHVYIVAGGHKNQDSVERALMHELAGHYGLRKLFGNNIRAELADIRARLGGKQGILKLAKKFNVDIEHYATDFEKQVSAGEMTTELADDLLFDELLAHVSEMPRLAKPLERLWQKVRKVLAKLGFTKTAGYTNADLLDLVQEIGQHLQNGPRGPGGPGGSRKKSSTTSRDSDQSSMAIPQFSRGKPGYQPSMSADEALAKRQSKLMHSIKQALYSAPVIGQTLDKMGRSKYALLTLRQLGEVSGWVNKPLGRMVDNYLAEINKMTATQNTLAEEAATISQDLSDWAKKHRADSDQLFSFAHDATLADVDPSDAFQSRKEDLEKSIAKYERILKEEGGVNSERGAKAFEQLQEDRKAYDNEDNRRREHVRLRNVWGTLNQEQRRRFRQMRDHYIEQSAKMNEALEQQINRAVEDAKVRKAMIAELRQQQERASKGLYFPLSRHGDYWIDFVDENDERQFMMFETKGEMELNAQKLRDAGFDINTGMKAQFNEVQKASLPFVADVIKMIRSSHMNELMKNSLSDEIYQMYLRTLPARSMRRNFIHRKGVAGFSQDAIRALADQGFKQSRQQARLDHMDILDNHLDGIQKYVGKYYETYGNEMPHKVEADRVVEELNQRHEWVRNPARSAWAQKLTGLGFVWLLGLTPAAALVNLTQLAQIAIPVLGSQHGMANASKEIGRATKEFFKATTTKNRNKEHGFLAAVTSGQEKAALLEAIRQGAIDTTQAADLMGLAENPNAKYSGAWNKAMNVIGFAFHHAEVFNREVTFLAAYRLAKEKLGDHDKAIDQAIKDTFDSHYDYSSLNRARFMQSDLAAVALQFKQYSQNTTYYLWSNLLKALKGESPEVKAIAKKQLLGTLASTFVIGGAGALPLSLIMTAINAAEEIVGDDDEPWDAETELKAMLSGAFGKYGKEAAALIWHGTLPSIGGRISLDDLWVRGIDRDIDPDKAYMEYMKQAAGPVVGGIALSWAQGLSDMTNDRFARGIERMPPKAIKDILKTARFIREEGITTRTGSEVVGDLTSFELAGQAMGFSVGRANIQYDENNGIKNYELHVQKRRQRLMNAYYTAYRLKDSEGIKEVMRKIKRFNSSEYGRLNPISNKNLQQSMKARQRNLARTNNGLQVSPKLQKLVAEYDVF